MEVNGVQSVRRVIAYVDGFNLYFGLRHLGLRRGYWLDIPRLLARYLTQEETLVETKYFTSRISGPEDKRTRQNEYLDALMTLPGMSLYFGQYQLLRRRCDACRHEWELPNEKMTDVNIAVELLKDAMLNRLDHALLVSADSDLSAPVRAMRELWPEKRVVVAFPPGRGSVVLQSLAHEKRRIRTDAVLKCQLPEMVVGLDGFPRRRPEAWAGSGPEGG